MYDKSRSNWNNTAWSPIKTKKISKVQKDKRNLKKWTEPGDEEDMTTMQKMAVSKLQQKVAEGGKIVLADILMESWYSKKTARTPWKVFKKRVVLKKIKEIELTPDGMKTIHTQLLNSRRIEFLKYSVDFPPEDVISLIESHIPWSIYMKHFPIPELGLNGYEFLMPNDANRIKALELAYKLYPRPEKLENPELRARINSKRLDIIRALAEKHKLLLKKPE